MPAILVHFFTKSRSLVSNCCSWSDYVLHLPGTDGKIVFCMSQEHIVRFKIQRMSFSHAPSFAVSLRSTQFRSIFLCWIQMPQISTKDTKTFPIPPIRVFFNVSPRVFCRRVTTSACSFLLYLAQPVHPPFTLPSTCFTHSIQQFSTSRDVFGLHVTASLHPLVGTATQNYEFIFVKIFMRRQLHQQSTLVNM